jgi:hypothetical protein
VCEVSSSSCWWKSVGQSSAGVKRAGDEGLVRCVSAASVAECGGLLFVASAKIRVFVCERNNTRRSLCCGRERVADDAVMAVEYSILRSQAAAGVVTTAWSGSLFAPSSSTPMRLAAYMHRCIVRLRHEYYDEPRSIGDLGDLT